MNELSVVETRTVVKELRENRNFDLSDYALTSLKYRLGKLMLVYKYKNVDAMLQRILDEDEFFDSFVHDLLVSTTEMFRDPSLWRWLKEDFFPNAAEKIIGNNYRIWFPLCVDGFEVHTLAIILKELDLLDKVRIYVSVLSNKSIKVIKEGLIPIKKFELSAENYVRYQGTNSLDDYIEKQEYTAKRSDELNKHIEFINSRELLAKGPGNVKLTMFRNHLIYFAPGMQDRLLNKLHACMAPTGHLILGAKERIKNVSTSNMFEIINDSESVYKKKFNG